MAGREPGGRANARWFARRFPPSALSGAGEAARLARVKWRRSPTGARKPCPMRILLRDVATPTTAGSGAASASKEQRATQGKPEVGALHGSPRRTVRVDD